MKVALVYDRINKWGGAERILLALHRIFPDAPLFTSVYDSQKARWAKIFDIKTSFLQYIPFSTHHELFAGLMPIAFESFCFKEFDIVISVTSEAAKGVITFPQTKHICVCLTPTRYLWSGYEDYFEDRKLRIITAPLVSYLRSWDKIAADRPDVYISISHEVKKRIKHYYHRESTVIYPPVMIDDYFQSHHVLSSDSSYFLIVSRLSRFTKYKKVDLAVSVCSKLKLPLVVVGGGDIGYFRQFAGPTVRFAGMVSDRRLGEYYSNCRALIFPSYEDFGLTAIEAQAYGKPVIALRRGGALETIVEGKTGKYFDMQTQSSLFDALKSFRENDYNSDDCRKNAQRFSFAHFENGIHSIIKRIINL